MPRNAKAKTGNGKRKITIEPGYQRLQESPKRGAETASRETGGGKKVRSDTQRKGRSGAKAATGKGGGARRRA